MRLCNRAIFLMLSADSTFSPEMMTDCKNPFVTGDSEEEFWGKTRSIHILFWYNSASGGSLQCRCQQYRSTVADVNTAYLPSMSLNMSTIQISLLLFHQITRASNPTSLTRDSSWSFPGRAKRSRRNWRQRSSSWWKWLWADAMRRRCRCERKSWRGKRESLWIWIERRAEKGERSFIYLQKLGD